MDKIKIDARVLDKRHLPVALRFLADVVAAVLEPKPFALERPFELNDKYLFSGSTEHNNLVTAYQRAAWIKLRIAFHTSPGCALFHLNFYDRGRDAEFGTISARSELGTGKVLIYSSHFKT